jgi:phosphatidylglycerophosphatase A
MNRAALFVATVGGVGYFPIAPGTAGSALAVAGCAALGADGHPWWLLGAAAALYFPACWAAGVAERIAGQRDPGIVVIDEVVGQLVTLAAAPAAGGWKYWLAGFIIFRALDVLKPFPARRLERLPGGWGIVADDVMAGVYGWALLSAARWAGL